MHNGHSVISWWLCSARKVHLALLWPWPLTSDLDNLFSNCYSHNQYLWQVSLKSLHSYTTETLCHVKNFPHLAVTFDIWSLTVNIFSAMPNHVVNICAKFHLKSLCWVQKYNVIHDIGQVNGKQTDNRQRNNGRTDEWSENTMLSAYYCWRRHKENLAKSSVSNHRPKSPMTHITDKQAVAAPPIGLRGSSPPHQIWSKPP